MSDTPLTDAFAVREMNLRSPMSYVRALDFARDLECQLAEAIDALKVLRYWLTTIETRNRSEDVYYEHVDGLLRQLDERRKHE